MIHSSEYDDVCSTLRTTFFFKYIPDISKALFDRIQASDGSPFINALIDKEVLQDCIQKNITLVLGRVFHVIDEIDNRSLEDKLAFVVRTFCSLANAAEEWVKGIEVFETPVSDKKERRKRREQAFHHNEDGVEKLIEERLVALQPILFPHGADSLYLTGSATLFAPAIMNTIERNLGKAAAWIRATILSRDLKDDIFAQLLSSFRTWILSPNTVCIPSLQIDDTFLTQVESSLESIFHAFFPQCATWTKALPKRTIAIKLLSFICLQLHTYSIKNLLHSGFSHIKSTSSSSIAMIDKISSDDAFFKALVAKILQKPAPAISQNGSSILELLTAGLQVVISNCMAGHIPMDQVKDIASDSFTRMRNFILSKQFDLVVAKIT